MTDENDCESPTADIHGQPRQLPATPPAPLRSTLPSDSEGRVNSTKDEADELAREFRAAEKWVIGTNIVLAIVGIVALCIYYGQLVVMRGQLGEIIKQYPEIKTSANAAKSAADTARETLLNAQAQFRAEERPWIAVAPGLAAENLPPIVVDPRTKDVMWNVVMQAVNIGKTPAVSAISMRYELRKGPSRQTAEEVRRFVPTYPNHGERGGGFIAPNQSPITLATTKTPHFTAEEFAKIQSGEWTAYIVGAIIYNDTFRPKIPPYETLYCYQYHPTGMPMGDCGFVSEMK
jgi:hypothetical protein